jgi:hypothetical protein
LARVIARISVIKNPAPRLADLGIEFDDLGLPARLLAGPTGEYRSRAVRAADFSGRSNKPPSTSSKARSSDAVCSRHRHQEFIRLLNAIKCEVPADKMVHVVVDNYATHKHPKFTAWLTRHSALHLPLQPDSCSWANAETNDKPKPFVWTKSADAILAAVNRGRQALEAIH